MELDHILFDVGDPRFHSAGSSLRALSPVWLSRSPNSSSCSFAVLPASICRFGSLPLNLYHLSRIPSRPAPIANVVPLLTTPTLTPRISAPRAVVKKCLSKAPARFPTPSRRRHRSIAPISDTRPTIFDLAEFLIFDHICRSLCAKRSHIFDHAASWQG